jgi:hypothetical protein
MQEKRLREVLPYWRPRIFQGYFDQVSGLFLRNVRDALTARPTFFTVPHEIAYSFNCGKIIVYIWESGAGTPCKHTYIL